MELIRTSDIAQALIHLNELRSRIYRQSGPDPQVNGDFFEKAYFIVENGAPLCGLVLYNNPWLCLEGKHAFCFGNFEAKNEPRAVRELFHAVLADIGTRSSYYLIGPMNGSTWDNYRFNDFENNSPFLLEQVHPYYYNKLVQSAGFEILAGYQSRIDREMPCDSRETRVQEEKFREMGVRFRPINLENYGQELEKLFPFICKSFENNFLYTPISSTHFREKYLQAKEIIRERFVRIAENAEGEIIAFAFCYPNLLEGQEKQLVIKTIARNPDPKWKGLGNVLVNQVISQAKKDGFQAIIHAYMIDQGTSTGISDAYLGKAWKSYKLYFKKLG